jgi:imidazolonepropionase-like amidohydrolase
MIMTRFRLAVMTGGVLAALVVSHGSAQERARDRRRFLAPDTPTTDDPRRTPIDPAVPRGPAGSIVLRGGRVFDATGLSVRPATLVITRNTIAAVLPPASTTWPADARIIDVPGMTVMPGLIDLHTHITDGQGPRVPKGLERDLADSTLRGVERLRYYAESGITSVRDTGSHDSIFRLKAWVRERRVVGPRIFAAGRFITAPGGHSAEGEGSAPDQGATRLANGADDWRKAVREQFDRGADFIKVGSHFSRDEIRAAVEEAHALGLRITCDCETFYIDWAVDAGVDMVEHPLPRTDEVVQKMAARGVDADPTLVPYDIIFEDNGGYFDSTSRRFTFSREANLQMLRRLRSAGIKLGVATDLVSDWFLRLPAPYIAELGNFVRAGFSIPEVLREATSVNAELLDMNDKLGTLEPGKLADVLVVNGQPEQRLEDLAKVEWVIRDGEVIVQHGQPFQLRHVPMVPKPK